VKRLVFFTGFFPAPQTPVSPRHSTVQTLSNDKPPLTLLPVLHPFTGSSKNVSPPPWLDATSFGSLVSSPPLPTMPPGFFFVSTRYSRVNLSTLKWMPPCPELFLPCPVPVTVSVPWFCAEVWLAADPASCSFFPFEAGYSLSSPSVYWPPSSALGASNTAFRLSTQVNNLFIAHSVPGAKSGAYDCNKHADLAVTVGLAPLFRGHSNFLPLPPHREL